MLASRGQVVSRIRGLRGLSEEVANLGIVRYRRLFYIRITAGCAPLVQK